MKLSRTSFAYKPSLERSSLCRTTISCYQKRCGTITILSIHLAGVKDRSETTARTGHRQFSSELPCQSYNAQSLCPWSISSLSLSQTFSGSLRMLRVCSTTVLLRAATLRVRHFPPKPLEELHRCSPSVCDHFVRDSARVPLPLTITVQHKLLPRTNVSRMYAECFDKVLYHVNSRTLKCKMTNVITRLLVVPFFDLPFLP